MAGTLRIVAISDTHNLHRKIRIPDGDVLVHAGDISMEGDLRDVEAFDAFLGTLPHRHKIVICGNHDFCFEREPLAARSRIRHATYLEDAGLVVEGVKFWGSPWQPWFFDWAFNLQRGPEIAEKWALIPDDTDVLITHGPPRGHGDRTTHGDDAGCDDLLRRIEEIRPKAHIFGHIHEGYGVTRNQHTLFVNASTCTVNYRASNPPVVLEYSIADGVASVVENPESVVP